MARSPRIAPNTTTPTESRRQVLASLGIAALWMACGDAASAAGETSGTTAPGAGSTGTTGGTGPTPACEETADDIEGPYHKQGAPELVPDEDGRVILSPEEPGERIVLHGKVLGADCTPLADAEIDLWHADADGKYDLAGFVLRGRVRTGRDGGFAIVTVLPGRYLNGATYRPRHLHVKVRAAQHAELTTQLYFPGDPFNESDAFFDERLLVTESIIDGERLARFDVVLAPGPNDA